MKLILSLSLSVFTVISYSQDNVRNISTHFGFENEIEINLSQNAFSPHLTNGGTNSLSALLNMNTILKYENKYIISVLNSKFGLGFNNTDKFRKNVDYIEMQYSTDLKRSKSTNLYFKTSLRSQFLKGYNANNDTSHYTSSFFNPAYVESAVGVCYKSNYLVRFSPLSSKITILRDASLYHYFPENYGVTNGKYTLLEIGANLSALYMTKIFKVCSLELEFNSFASYVPKFKPVDFQLDFTFTAAIHKYFNTNVKLKLVNDQDVDNSIQYFSSISFAVIYNFK